MNIRISPLQAHLALLLAMVIWGSSFTLLKITIDVMPAMQVMFFRMLAGSVLLLFFVRWWLRGVNYQKGDWKWLLLMAAFEPCLYFLFEGLALKYTSASQAGLITSILPLMIAAGAWLFLKEQIKKRQWFGFMLAVAGVIWMSAYSEVSSSAPNPALGNFLEVLAMMSAVGYTLLVKKLTSRYNPVFLTAFQTFVGAVFFLPLALSQPLPEQVEPQVIWGIVYLGVVVSLGAYGLYNIALSRLSATVTGAYINLIPVFALLVALLVLKDTINLQQWLAVLVIFTGIGISQYQQPVRGAETPLPPAPHA
ncbi:DMT family transporter [Marinospirillum sp.]|uniref:DMT family transporter n=1 Tax=Marinospirillum sp. TaxID=2183934 RepID=UPI0025C4CD66|nr:DMT family transporter [Marinospirillum sp.]